MPTCCRHRRHVYLRVIYFANTLFVRSQCGVCCVYMSAAKHFGFVRSCLAAVLGYFFILLDNIYRLSLV